MLFVCFSSKAQTIKEIKVSDKQSFSDHILLENGEKNIELVAKFVFDEPKNSLIVSIISYDNLFVFDTNVIYKNIISCGKLHPAKLPYVVEFNPKTKFIIGKSIKKLFKKYHTKKRSYEFQNWISYTNLQAQEYQSVLINEFLERKFDILNKETKVQVGFNEILTIENISHKQKERYEIPFLKDMDRVYNITIERNPCFEKDEEIEFEKQRYTLIKKNYDDLIQKFDVEVKDTVRALEYNKMRDLIISTYPKVDKINACGDIAEFRRLYNGYVDSLQLTGYDIPSLIQKQEIDYVYVQQQTTKLDNNIAKWQLSSILVEKKDLYTETYNIIEDVDALIQKSVVRSDKAIKVVANYKKAVSLFREICKVN